MKITRLWGIALLVMIAIVLGTTSASAQDSTTLSSAFVAYQCTFVAERNSVQIRAVLTGSDGLPLALDSYSARVINVASGALVPDAQVEREFLTERPPLRMILVFDLTETIPLQELITAVRDEMIPGLEIEDELALLPFSDLVGEVSPYYTDKNRLLNERLTDVALRPGDNQLFNAVLAAVNATDATSPFRQVIVILTDSSRRGNQATVEEIVQAADATRVQIYPIGFTTQDRPNTSELTALANGTGGYAWFYESNDPIRADLARSVGDYLRRLPQTLNSEVVFTVSLRGQPLDETGAVTLDVAIDAENERDMTSRIRCPVEQLTHTLTFAGGSDDRVSLSPIEFEVIPQTRLSSEFTSVAFLVDDEVVQDLPDNTFRFDTPDEAPGVYVIRAQLRDRQTNEVLATTLPINLYAQQPLELRTVDGETEDLNGTVRLEATTETGFTLPPVQFLVADVDAPETTYPLGEAEVGSDGRAILTVENIGEEIRGIFSETRDMEVFVTAVIPGSTPQVPPLAISDPLQLGVIVPLNEDEFLIPPTTATIGALSCGLLALNLYIATWVLFTRAKGLIFREDSTELSEHLMSITIRRGGSQQTIDLTKKTYTIGRGNHNDINLGDDPKASRSHGAILWRRGGWVYVNRKRNARTKIDGHAYSGLAPYRLEPVTEIQIGDAIVIFHAMTQYDISELARTNL